MPRQRAKDGPEGLKLSNGLLKFSLFEQLNEAPIQFTVEHKRIQTARVFFRARYAGGPAIEGNPTENERLKGLFRSTRGPSKSLIEKGIGLAFDPNAATVRAHGGSRPAHESCPSGIVPV